MDYRTSNFGTCPPREVLGSPVHVQEIACSEPKCTILEPDRLGGTCTFVQCWYARKASVAGL